MTASVVSIAALREQRGPVPDTDRDHKPGKIVARFATAGELCDGRHAGAVVAVALGDEVVRGRVFLARRDQFGQVRLVLEHPPGHEPRATALVLRPESRLLVLAREVRPSGSAAPPGASGPRGRR